MLRGIGRRLSYANVVATMALFIALGGASYAAIKLPAASVGTSQLKANAVTGAKVKDRSLSAADFKGPLTGATGAQGPAGPQGPAGRDATAAAIADGSLTGAKLAAGAVTAGKLGTVTVRTDSVMIAPSDGGSVQADCLPGEQLLGGGVDGPVPSADGWVIYGSWPTAAGDGWRGRARNTSAGQEGFSAYALCLAAG